MELFEKTTHDYTEKEVLAALGVTVQTLRNWRMGYRNYPAKLVEGRDWYRLTDSIRAPVYYSGNWVDKMKQIKQLKDELK